eukprot:490493_1
MTHSARMPKPGVTKESPPARLTRLQKTVIAKRHELDEYTQSLSGLLKFFENDPEKITVGPKALVTKKVSVVDDNGKSVEMSFGDSRDFIEKRQKDLESEILNLESDIQKLIKSQELAKELDKMSEMYAKDDIVEIRETLDGDDEKLKESRANKVVAPTEKPDTAAHSGEEQTLMEKNLWKYLDQMRIEEEDWESKQDSNIGESPKKKWKVRKSTRKLNDHLRVRIPENRSILMTLRQSVQQSLASRLKPCRSLN